MEDTVEFCLPNNLEFLKMKDLATFFDNTRIELRKITPGRDMKNVYTDVLVLDRYVQKQIPKVLKRDKLCDRTNASKFLELVTSEIIRFEKILEVFTNAEQSRNG